LALLDEAAACKKVPLTAMQLDDSASADHVCFADSTDVFELTGVF
jgi:hypothetical protein